MATLSVNIDPTGAQQGARTVKRSMAEINAAADKAEQSVTRLGTASRQAASGEQALASSAKAATGSVNVQTTAVRASTLALNQQVTASRMAANMNRQLSFQLIDIGQALATAPTMGIFALQNLGFQVAQIGQLYMGQGGFNQAIKDSARQIGTFAVRAGPAIGLIAAIGAGIAGMQHAINETSGVTVSFSDVAIGTFEALRDVIYETLKPAIDAIAPWFATAWNLIVDGTQIVGNAIINSFRAAFADIKFVWSNLPNIMGAATIGAANAVIGGIEGMVNKAIELINGLATRVNSLLSTIPGLSENFRLGTIDSISLGRLDNAPARDFRAAAEAHVANIQDIMSSDPLGDFFQRVRGHAIENAVERAKKDAKGGGKSEAEKMAEDYDKLVRSANQFIAEQQLEQQTLGMTEEAANRLRYEQELLNKAANDNIKLTPQQRAELQGLAAEMAAAEAQTSRLKDAFEFAKETTKGFFSDFVSGLREGKGIWESFANAASNALDKIIDKLLNQFIDAIFTANSALGGGGGGFLGGILSLFGLAKGGVVSQGNVIPFARGGIVSQPTIFPMATGMGLMGEAGPEAVMPLRRGPGGRLGVEAHAPANQNRPQEVVVTVKGVFVDDNGVIRGQIVDMGTQAAQAGASIAVKHVKDSMPGFIADAQAREL